MKKVMMVMTAFFMLPFGAMAEECTKTPECESLGFIYTGEQCGEYDKVKCPFGDKYFCTYCDENKGYYKTCPEGAACEPQKTATGLCLVVIDSGRI